MAMLLNLLSKAATVAMLCFVVSSMLATGAGLTVARIIEPLRKRIPPALSSQCAPLFEYLVAIQIQTKRRHKKEPQAQ
jgi:hypothetical protein